jgi:hypothetical protein
MVCTSVLCRSKPQDWVVPDEVFAIFIFSPRNNESLVPRFDLIYLLDFLELLFEAFGAEEQANLEDFISHLHLFHNKQIDPNM